MENQMVNICLHGKLGKKVGKKWKLNVSSVAEAIRAIQANSEGVLYKNLMEGDRKNIKYKIIIDDKIADVSKIDVNKPETLKHNDLSIKRSLKKIDIVPVIEGSVFIPIIAGAALIGLGAISGSAMLIAMGIMLVMNGMANMLSEPPDYEEFRDFQDVSNRGSYLFNGPQNVMREGGPVPVGYGRLLVGSQLIGASYDIAEKEIVDSTITT